MTRWLFGFILIIILLSGWFIYYVAFSPNVSECKTPFYLKIPTGSNFNDVLAIIKEKKYFKNINTFTWLAKKKNLPHHIHAGAYLLKKNMNNNRIINLIRSGQQEPIHLVFNDIRTKEKLSSVISAQIEIDSLLLLSLLMNDSIAAFYGFNTATFISMFIPNTYEFIWNTSPVKFVDRMNHEYKAFWNDRRIAEAKDENLKPVEVSILASIIEEETNKTDEYAKIAGVYINRLKKGMLLQADPTVKFALHDFTIRRVLDKYTEINSPYNTYKFSGLPPGPIRIPSIAAIEAVLNYEKHKYLYFCASYDGSGYHNFSATLQEHNRYAKKYQDYLNRKKIFE